MIVACDLAAKLDSNKNDEREADHRAGGQLEAGVAGHCQCDEMIRDGMIRSLIDPLIDPGSDRRHHPIP